MATAQTPTPVLTQAYDSARDGLNATETTLTPANVNPATFGRLFNLPVDGVIYAQPLYVPGVAISGQGTHNVVYVATMHDSVYAFDADGLSVQPLWHASFINPSGGVTTEPVSDNGNNTDTDGEIGILSTPVIDPSTGTLYLVAKTDETSGQTTNQCFRLHALDITSGAERAGSPTACIQASVPGTGTPNSGGNVLFTSLYTLQRPGLALNGNDVYVAFGAWGDVPTWHGWILAFDKSTLQLANTLNITPNGSEGEGGIWSSGRGLAIDASGSLYLSTGNGNFDGATNYGDSILKLSSTLGVTDYFTPYNQQSLDSNDLDVTSGGLVLLPDSAGTTAHPHIMIGCSKDGTVYVVDRDNLGQFNSSGDGQIIQELNNAVGGIPVNQNSPGYVENCYSGGTYWNGHVYFGGISDSVKEFNFTNGLLSTSAVSQTPEVYQFPGANAVVSANGSTNGILWAVENAGSVDAGRAGTAVLHAYDATNLGTELYSSNQSASDLAGAAVKFTLPTIANGKVYVGTQSSVAVYGLFSSIPQASTPVFSPAGGTYSGSVSVSISDSSPGTTIYYTTDGTTPTTSSSVYTGPILLSNSATVSAIAVGGGYRLSSDAVSTYVINGVAPITFVQVASATPQTSVSTVSVTYPSPEGAGDMNIVVVGWNDTTASVQSVTDTAGNAYTLAVGPTSGTGVRQSIYYASGIVGGNDTVAVNFSPAAAEPDIRVLEYRGVTTLDAAAAASGSGTSASSGSATIHSNNELIFGADTISTVTNGAGTGFTARIITAPDSDLAEDEIAGSTGSYSATATLTSGAWVMQMAAFSAAPLPAPTITGVSPSSGSTAGGTSVTITGTNFAAGATVTFGTAAATNVTVVNSTSITATTPVRSAGAVNVTVTQSGQSSSLTNGFTYITGPSVTSVSPNAGPIGGGSAVTITGTNFASGAAVTFGTAPATNVTVVNSTTITATTPAGSAGPVTVIVTSGGQSGSLTSGFTYIGQPTVTTVSPSSGPTTGGTAVTITGTNFASGATVTFGTASATNVTVVNSTTITATTPAGSAGAVTVSVTNPGPQSGSLTSGFTYTTSVAISYVQVASATPQSTTSTVSVSYPSAQTAGDMNIVVVGWNDTTATVQSVTDSAGNTYKLAIGPTSGTGVRQSIYYASGINAGSNTVTVNFSPAAAYPDIRVLEYRGLTNLDVTAGASGSGTTASSGSATTTSTNELIFGADTISTVTTAAGSGFSSRIITSPDSDLAEDKTATTAGSYSATATLSSGLWVMQMATFSAAPPPAPTVTSVNPSSGSTAGGTAVTITGTNFVAGATVTFGTASATNVTVVNSTTITATTPAGSAGAVTVTVTQSGQSGSVANGFTYVVTPIVSSVSPNSGSTAGGTTVTITGTNFAPGATVSFGGTAATNVTVVNSTTIAATTSAGSAGPVTVTVTSNGQSGSLSSGFTYVLTPTVSGVSPSSGSTAGGTSVTITGTNFAAGATVTFGTAASTNVTVVNSTTITATTPAGSAGAVNVTVTQSGQSGSLTNGFTYVVTPSVSSVSPSSGPTTGGTSVTITGTNFASGATVGFGGTPAANVTVVSGTGITATTPAGSSGPVTVTVTSGGQSDSLTSGFTYVAQPTVSSVSPSSGPTTGGTAVTITGTNFASGATVTFGTASATNVTVVNSTTITATTPAGSSGAVTVSVTNPGPQSGSLATAFTYTTSAAISYAQVASATPQSPTATVSVSYPSAQTAGDLNIVVVGWNDTTATVQSVTDSAGNTYQLAIGPTSGTGVRQSIYYASGINAGSNTVTVTFSQAAVYPDIRVLEYHGVSALDVTAGASGSGTTASSGSATTTSANELIFAADTISTITTAAGSGFTSRIITSPDSDLAEDETATITGSYSATATLSSGAWVMQMVTFR